MLIKKLDLTDFEIARKASQIRSVAFHYSDRYQELLCREKQEEGGRIVLRDPAQGDPPVTTWGAFADDNLIAVASAIDFSMRYAEQDVSMSGIQGVATLPEFRRRGAIRHMLREMLYAERQRGCVFSYLHPFSYAYYQKFGYGFGSRRIRAAIPMDLLRELEVTVAFHHCRDNDLADIRYIYSRFISSTNGPVIRGNDRWQQLINKDPYLNGDLTYIAYDEKEQPQAYIMLQDRIKINNKDKKALVIRDWACSSMRYFLELLAFLQNFASEYRIVEILMPEHIDLEMIFSEMISVQRQLESFGQVRLLNVPEALELLGKPAGLPDFSFSLQVIDDYIPANSGVYKVNLGAEGNTVRFSADLNQNYDIKLTINSLSSMLYGSLSLQELVLWGKAQYAQGIEEKCRQYLENCFQRKANAMFDHF